MASPNDRFEAPGANQTPDYARLRALGFVALKRLGSQGYAVPPAEGLELVHDFLVEVVPGLQERFDSRHGAFSTYAYASFVRFARPRILAARRWRESLVAPEDMSRTVDSIVVTGASEDHLDLERLRSALNALAPVDRTILLTRFSSRSEREAARKSNLSRYRFREASCVALGKLFVSLDEPGVLEVEQFRIARALWREQRTPQEVARELSISTSEVAEARRKLLASIALVLNDPHSSATTSKTMITDYCELWRSLIRAPESPAVVRAVRAERDRMLSHLDDCDACDEIGGDLANAEAVYAALALDEQELPAEERGLLDELLQARQDDDAAVVRAVQEGLLMALPPALRDLEFIEGTAGPGPAMTLFKILEGVSLMLHRLARAHPGKGPIALYRTGRIRLGNVELGPEAIQAQVTASSGSPRTQSANAVAWIVDAIGSVPGLIPGTSGTPSGRNGVELRLETRNPNADLFAMWKPSAASEAEAQPYPSA